MTGVARSLTQAEAERRAALLQVQRYDIEVDLTDLPTGPAVRCVSTITFTCSEPGAETFVECAAEVVSAELNGTRLPASAAAATEARIPLSGLAARNTLVVESVQRETSTGEGVHKAVDPADGEVYLWTSFEPDEAKHVWACFDQPDLKAPHAFTVLAPSTWTVLSNSAVDTVEDGLEPEVRRWRFPDTPPLSTYNPVVLAGPFHAVRRTPDRTGDPTADPTVEGEGFDLGLYARRSLATVLDRDADELFTITAQGLQFYGDAFGMPFPQQKYDQVFLPEFGGAMENYGCVAWSDTFLRRSTPTPTEWELFAKVLLHEMAHMWFGNIVTMRWWDDLWLNEAFAEFACNWAAVRATSYVDSWAGHLAAEELDAYLADQGPVSHPIRQPIHDVDQAASIFDAITYPKGASVLHQLMIYVGEDRFRDGMTAYFARHAWGNTTLQDLMDALAEASGKDLDGWREAWLERAGTDRLTLEADGSGHVLAARAPEGQPRPHVLEIGAYRRSGDLLEAVGRTRVAVTGGRTPVELPAADLYVVNDEDLTFATGRPDPATRDALFTDAAALPTVLSRGVAVATVWDMLVNGEATAAEVVPALTGVLRAETAESVVESYMRLASQAARSWAPEGDRTTLMNQVATTCRALAEQPARRLIAARGVAANTSDPDDLAWLLEVAGGEADLRWRVLVRRAALSADDPDARPTDAEIEAALQADPDPDAWVRGAEVRAALNDPEAKDATWRLLTADRRVPVSLAGRLAATMWQPGQERILERYQDQYLALMGRLHEGGMISAMVYTTHLLPAYGINPGYLDRVLAAAQDAAPVVRQTATERVDELRRMLTARGA